MKLKPKFLHFWRNNKRCIGMYNALIMILLSFSSACVCKTLPCIINAAFAIVWLIVWSQEREIDSSKRCHYVNKHRYKKYANEMHTRGLKEGHQVGYDSGYNDGFQDAIDEIISNHDNQP